MMRDRFVEKREYDEMEDLLDLWTTDSGNIRSAFLNLREALSQKEKAVFFFKSRPGISHSFRGYLPAAGGADNRLFVMVDIVDDDPEARWLSVCFYGDVITDPEGAGDLVPGGLLGEDGYCFDLYEYDNAAVLYLTGRIDEAYRNTLTN